MWLIFSPLHHTYREFSASPLWCVICSNSTWDYPLARTHSLWNNVKFDQTVKITKAYCLLRMNIIFNSLYFFLSSLFHLNYSKLSTPPPWCVTCVNSTWDNSLPLQQPLTPRRQRRIITTEKRHRVKPKSPWQPTAELSSSTRSSSHHAYILLLSLSSVFLLRFFLNVSHWFEVFLEPDTRLEFT